MDTIESEEKIVWSNGMIAIAETHGLKTIEAPITEIYVENGSTLNPGRHGFWRRDRCSSSVLQGLQSRLSD